MAKKKLKKKVKNILILIILIIICLLVFKFIPKENVAKETNKIFLESTNFYNINELYIPLNGSVSFDDYNIEIDNNDILSINNKSLIANKVGNSKIKLLKDNKYQDIEIHVVDIISNYQINNKELLKCNEYSKEDEILLEKILSNQIEFAGYKTRAGVVQAARFLSLEFKQKLNYFYENGRMTSNDTFDFCDGEGRYLHKGLYLSEDDFKELKASRQGPVIWGCPMYEETRKTTLSNGIDCSGFVTWAITNAGYDILDYGAKDIFKLGEKVEFSDDSVFNKIKVGDLVGRNGHVGILVGIKDDKYYIAESLDYDLHILNYTKNDLLNSELKFFILMDDYYKEDGNLTSYWN